MRHSPLLDDRGSNAILSFSLQAFHRWNWSRRELSSLPNGLLAQIIYLDWPIVYFPPGCQCIEYVLPFSAIDLLVSVEDSSPSSAIPLFKLFVDWWSLDPNFAGNVSVWCLPAMSQFYVATLLLEIVDEATVCCGRLIHIVCWWCRNDIQVLLSRATCKFELYSCCFRRNPRFFRLDQQWLSFSAFVTALVSAR